MRVQQEEEEKKDLTYEDFLKQFEAHIDGTAANEREAHDSADEVAEEIAKKSQKKSTISRKESQLNKTSSHFVGDADSVENRQEGMSKRSSKKSNMDASRYQSASMNKTADTFKYEIPDTCKVSMIKKVLIEKLPAKYFLASHPYPKIEGEMIIFRPRKDDQDPEDKSVIVYRDFSLRKRIETTPKTNNFTDGLSKKKRGGPIKKEEEKQEPEH